MSNSDISSQVDALRSDLASLADRFATYAEREQAAIGETLSRQARAARRTLNSKVAALSDQSGELAEAARAQAHDIQDALEAYVVENPIRSVVIAAGVGLILGAMSRR